MLYVQVMNKPYKESSDLMNLIKYAFGEHCRCGLYGAQGLLRGTAESMYADVMDEKKEFSKDSGRMAVHMIVSFDENMMEYVTPETALRIGYDICAACFPGFQAVFGIHDNTKHLHIHFVINTVSYYTGNKFCRSRYEIWHMEKEMERITQSYKPVCCVDTLDELCAV